MEKAGQEVHEVVFSDFYSSEKNPLLEQLGEKVSAEYKDFVDSLKKQNSVETAIESAYEIVWKDNISQYLVNEDPDLSDEQYDALLSSQSPLGEIYDRFLKTGGITSYSDLYVIIERAADSLIEAGETERKLHQNAPLILHDPQTARSLGESALNDWRFSRRENIACAKAIIAAKVRNTTYGDMAGVTWFDAGKTVDDVLNNGFPAERLGYVIASQEVCTQNCLDNPRLIDGRFTGKIKDWAIKTFSQQENFPFRNFEDCDITSSLHHTLVNSLAEKFIDKQLELSAKVEKKPSVLGEIGKIKAEQETKKTEKPAPQKAKSQEQSIE